jgi:hypothetical protein
VNPFRERFSAALFDMFATGLEYIMLSEGVSRMINYLDDMFTTGAASMTECGENMATMVTSSEAYSVEVIPLRPQ